MVKSDSNRCGRNCFNCPICTSIMTTSPIVEGQQTYYILNCHYCMWTTLEIGIKFEKPTNIRGQLEKVKPGGKPMISSKPGPADLSGKSSFARESFSPSATEDSNPLEQVVTSTGPQDPHARFHALKQFYKDQIAQSASSETGLNSSSFDLATYSSPSSLARIMNIYSNLGSASSTLLKKSQQQPQLMREALTASEGLYLPAGQVPHMTDADALSAAYTSPSILDQRLHQYAPGNGAPESRKVDTLRPVPALLRTKRAKRCLACKHILTKPEIKPTSTRYRLRLLAASYLPLVSLKALPYQTQGIAGRFPGIDGGEIVLQPGVPSQWVLRLTNPLYERVKVSLGCPAVVEGRADNRGRRRQDRVTVLCPQFEMGPNGDVWDDALNASRHVPMNPADGATEGVAGRVYETGKNWVGIVIEIEPGFRPVSRPLNDVTAEDLQEEAADTEGGYSHNVMEIPIRVRLEWTVSETESRKVPREEKSASQKLLDDTEGNINGLKNEDKRELAYWMVLGVGRVDGQ